MTLTEQGSDLAKRVHEFVTRDFTPRYGEVRDTLPSHPLWQKLRELGTELWLDSGDIDDIDGVYTRQFNALTTNNSLLNKEVQKGTYDDLITEAADLLDGFSLLPEHEKRLELAFILNAVHGLKLVEKFDAYVSVEEHTDLTDDVENAVNYARRFHAICPERFIVKIPFSPAGLLATRIVRADGVPVNHTLGFSARQNYLAARIAQPTFVNVFMGRLNSFLEQNNLAEDNGAFAGEKSTLASQNMLRELRRSDPDLPTRQIGASFRSAGQIVDLAGIDVMTFPPEVARELLEMDVSPDDLQDQVDAEVYSGLKEGIDPRDLSLDTLWDVDPPLRECIEELENHRLDQFTSRRLVSFFHKQGAGDVLPKWSDQQLETSREEGKIPSLENWKEQLGKGVALDALMNLAGWNHFDKDQQDMDRKVQDVLSDD